MKTLKLVGGSLVMLGGIIQLCTDVYLFGAADFVIGSLAVQDSLFI